MKTEMLKMHSPNKVEENIEKIGRLFPNCLTERIVGYKEEVRQDGSREPIMERAIDFDMLRQELSSVIVEGPEERYQFTWPDKKKSILLANAPIAATLRPCREESVDFDNTENLYIEGDNLDVLKLLQETYLGKIKLIYIDPPYNTGHDFVYNDHYSESEDDYYPNSGQYDSDGNRLVQNTESNGRFHTDWLNMLYPRLKLAKALLSDDGVVFISIDENEIYNLHKICDEVFGESNFRTIITWQRKYSVSNNFKGLATICDYVLVYAKSPLFENNLLPRTSSSIDRYSNPDNDPRGPWKAVDYLNQATVSERPNLCYDIVNPFTGKVVKNGAKAWKYDKATHDKHVAENRIWWGMNGTNTTPALKLFLSEVRNGMTPHNWWPYEEVGHTQEATKEVASLMGRVVFDYPKLLRFLKRILEIASNDDSIVLDFFSGSATTAHAVMRLNAEDGGHRKFIMVQLPEETDEKSEAYKAGYKNICEIGKERIRRAGTKIKEQSPMTTADLDIGFRVLKLDSSNMKDVYYNPAEYEQSALDGLADNIKEDRTPEDLLFQVMLDLGILLSSKIEKSEIAGKKVFSVADGFLIACFDADITDDVITEIAKKKPYYFVLRDGSLSSDSVATNFDQIFATYSPETERKVL